ncbi:hypothetical protein Acr_14g0003970 [Actinidia rufa]|uniref:NB-ARC domain-containing protein n=1 Tax=Actinidia rufa TaxID=165716 RepID=A0A7J0FPX1_9ERIC|nr:hypothetical protein Acr_14g0003970 [Actinidia rufa]
MFSHDADDLVDDFAAEALLKRMVTPHPINLVEKVFHFFSTIGFYITMAYLLKDARDRLDDMASDRSKFYPVEQGVDLLVIRNKEREQTYSYVFEPNVVGRDADKKEIKKMIMETRNEVNVSVIAMTGIGGIGKTTLAQLVYNDAEVERYFQLKMWVSGLFFERKLKARDTCSSLMTCEVITAKDGENSENCYRAGEEEMAFKVGQEDPRLVTIGKEIVRKCAGNPLAIRVAGSLLYSKDTEYEWLSFKLCKFPGMPRNEDFNVLEVLKFRFPRLRVLDLHNLWLHTLPISVGELRHLKYLDLRYNKCLVHLPSSITKLRNLQTLRLSYCEYLQELQLTYLALNWGSPIDGDDAGNDDKLLLEPPAAPKYEEATDLQASSTVGIASFSPSPPPLVHAFVGILPATEIHAFTSTCRTIRTSWHQPETNTRDVANELIIDSYMGSYNVISLVFFYPCFQIEVSAYFSKSGFSCLPECIGNLTSLQEFDIFDCTKLITLSDGMQCLTTLKKLSIDLCSDFLYERCQEEVGEDWPKIAHIPEIKLGSF